MNLTFFFAMIIVYFLVALFAERLQVIVVERQRIALKGVFRAHERYDVVYVLGGSDHRRLLLQTRLAQRIVSKLRSSQPRPTLRLVDFAPLLGVGIARNWVTLLLRSVDSWHGVSFRWHNPAASESGSSAGGK